MKKSLFLLGLLLVGCLSFAQTLPDNIDISTSSNGVVALPANVPSAFINDGFVKYTKIQCPNGEAIHFVAQDELSDEQIVRARTLLEFYLKNVPGTLYGADKTTVINTMGTNDALLLLMNGADGEGPEPSVWGQPLFNDELPVEGDTWYMTNDYEHRDAAFEEILHLMHDIGIGVDGPNTISNPALPAYQAEIRAAQENAELINFAIWPIGADGSGPEPFVQDWYNELSQENSLSQEYLASVIDSYYGLWGAWNEGIDAGMWGIYIAQTRDDIATSDPMGLDVVEKYFSPYINVDMVIDASMNGIFSMNFDAGLPYTHKSQYLQHCYLTGSNNSGLLGNDLYNRLKGNSGDNTLEGGKGNDRLDGNGGQNTAIFSGVYTDYTIVNNVNYATVEDSTPNRDGVDTLWNIHTLQFLDQNVNITLTSSVGVDEEAIGEKNLNFYPNPANQVLNVETTQTGNLSILNITGQEVFRQQLSEGLNKIDVSKLTNGVYLASIDGSYIQKLIIQK